jgi:hypothetical protein
MGCTGHAARNAGNRLHALSIRDACLPIWNYNPLNRVPTGKLQYLTVKYRDKAIVVRSQLKKHFVWI